MPRRTDATSPTPAAPPRAGPGRPSKGGIELDVRERILDVAEEQFSKRGYEAVSTRAVAQQAGATAAMIHYYFSSKRALFEDVVARRADIVNRERLAEIDAYERGAGDKVSVEGAIAAFLRPVLVKLASSDRGWRNYLALIAQVANNHEWGGAVMTNSFDPVVKRLIDVVGKALPHAKPADLYWSYHFFSGALMLVLSETDRIDRLSKGSCRSTDIAAIEPRLIAFAAAGFERICTSPRKSRAKQ